MNHLIRRLNTYLDSIGGHAQQNDYSPLWRNFIREFELPSENTNNIRQFYDKNCRGYIPRSRSKYYLVDEYFESFIGWLTHHIQSGASYLIKPLKQKRVRQRYDWRTYKIKRYLSTLGIDYKHVLHNSFPQASLRPNFFSLRALYYHHLILKHTPIPPRPIERVLEIGPGAGTLSILLAKSLTPREYIAIDLPEMLPIMALEVSYHYPDASIILPNEVTSEFTTNKSNPTFIFLTPSQLHHVNNETVDLALNVDSLAEMPHRVAHSYIKFLNLALKNGGFMFLANRESRIIPGQAEINSMWTHPYAENDIILLLEHCPMRNYVMDYKSININRLSKKAATSKL